MTGAEGTVPPAGAEGTVPPAGAEGTVPPAGAEDAGPLAAEVARLAGQVAALAGSVAALTRSLAAVEEVVGSAGARTAARVRDVPREVEALLQLYRDHAPRAPMPPSGRWAMEATGLLELLWHVRTDRPALVLELGSGTSTVWLGYALERTGGRLISMDHDPGFGDRTDQLLRRHGLTAVAQVRQAPLRDLELGDRTFPWYDRAAFEDLAEVDLLLVDGPPGMLAPMARYPALPVLLPRLARRARVLLDDADRPDERQTVDQWLREIEGLTREPATVDTVAVLRYARPATDTTVDAATDPSAA